MNIACFTAHRAGRVLAHVVLWTAVGLFFTLQSLVSYMASGTEVHLGRTLVFRLGHWYAWGLLAPLLLGLARRYPLDGPEGRRHLARHVAAALVVAPLQVVLSTALRAGGFLLFGLLPAEQVAGYLAALPRLLLTGSFDGLVTYGVLLGLYQAYRYYHKYRERELRAAHLEARLARAQLMALKMQLHPHFLFNTLHSISALIHEAPEAAERMIARLSELLRLTLENAGVQEVPLRQELAFVERYLEIEQLRYHDRLTVHWEVAPESLEVPVPNLILQPLVENALRHGIAPRATPGRIEIVAACRGEALHLIVRDDGPGLPAGDGPVPEGVGLSTTRRRLAQHYGPAHRFTLHTPAGGGLEVHLSLPFHPAPAAP